VITAATPGIRSATVASTVTTFAWAWGLLRIFIQSMFDRLISAANRNVPVAFSMP
jgi:hypothetical protein